MLTNHPTTNVYASTDIDGDNKIGLAEAIEWLNLKPSLEFGTVLSPTGQVWMDRNLGASRVATSSTDTEAYGDLYQWGRGTDGHEKRDSGTTATMSISDTPGHGNFIIPTNDSFDWRTSQNDNLWQGASGINNPCPSGFRLPTINELAAELPNNDAASAYESPLKLVVAGERDIFYSSGAIRYADSAGCYWSGTVQNEYGELRCVGSLGYRYGHRAEGFSVRCLKD